MVYTDCKLWSQLQVKRRQKLANQHRLVGRSGWRNEILAQSRIKLPWNVKQTLEFDGDIPSEKSLVARSFDGQ